MIFNKISFEKEQFCVIDLIKYSLIDVHISEDNHTFRESKLELPKFFVFLWNIFHFL